MSTFIFCQPYVVSMYVVHVEMFALLVCELWNLGAERDYRRGMLSTAEGCFPPE